MPYGERINISPEESGAVRSDQARVNQEGTRSAVDNIDGRRHKPHFKVSNIGPRR